MKNSSIHIVLLPILLASATALLAWSMMLPPDDQIATDPFNNKPTPTATAVASQAPVKTANPTNTPAKATPSAVAASNQATPSKTATPAKATATPKPRATATPKPKATAKPEPSATPTPLPEFAIAATTPEDVLKEAKIKSGRVDPFHTLIPPEIPDFKSDLSIAKLELDNSIKTVKLDDIEPPPEPSITDGIVLKGIVNGGTDPIAIIEVDDSSQLVRPGEYVRKNILISTINASGRYIMLSKGSEKARVFLPEEE